MNESIYGCKHFILSYAMFEQQEMLGTKKSLKWNSFG